MKGMIQEVRTVCMDGNERGGGGRQHQSPPEELAISRFAEVVVVFEFFGLRFLDDEATGCLEAAGVVRVRFAFPFDDEAMFASGLEDSGRFDGCKDNEMSESESIVRVK